MTQTRQAVRAIKQSISLDVYGFHSKEKETKSKNNDIIEANNAAR
jgi:hypothetical protein